MDKFFERFKPGGGKKSGNKNPFGNLLSGQGGGTFSGQGQSLGGTLPGKVIPIELKQPGPLGVRVEKRSNSQKTAIVAMVVEGSQAEKAGLQHGDILCFQGSNGTEEIMYDQFLELAKSDLRPLCLEVRRIPTKASKSSTGSNHSTSSADAYARKQAVIAAAEAREKAAKAKSRPIPKKDSNYPNMMSTAERQRLEQERLARAQQMSEDNEPKSEEAKKAREAAKNSEAKLAAELGYNPYETSRATAGQARDATVAAQHGAMKGGSTADAAIPKVKKPRDPVGGEAKVNFDPQFTQAYEACVTSNKHEAVVNSFGIMRKLIVNATTKGQTDEDDAAKFRRVRLGNAKIKAAIVDVEGAFDLMMSVGFSLIEEDGESFLVFPAGSEGPDWLQAALNRMERYEKS